MTVTIELGPELCEQIRALVHDELNEQKNRQKFERLAMKIRGQLDQISGPAKSTTKLKADLGMVLNN